MCLLAGSWQGALSHLSKVAMLANTFSSFATAPPPRRLACRRLISINTENYKYHAGLQAALKLPEAAAVCGGASAGGEAAAAAAAAAAMTPEQRQRLCEVYAELQGQHPHSVAMKRMPLDFLVGDGAGQGAVQVPVQCSAKPVIITPIIPYRLPPRHRLSLPSAAGDAGGRGICGGRGRVRSQVPAARHPLALLGCVMVVG